MRTRQSLHKIGVTIAVFATVLSPARRALAFERQWHVGVDGGYAVLFEDGVSGFGGGAHAAYGLSDSFNAMLELDLTHHPDAAFLVGAGDNKKAVSAETIASGAAGIAYTIDVARAVPYIGLLAAGYRVGDLSPFSPGGQIALGLDYQLERNWAIGAQLRFHTIFTADAGAVAYATTFLRLEYLWGF